MPSNLPSINLIKNQNIPFFDKFINWALSIGRLIIIITETVAVIAFIYRFSLDEKLVEIHSSIKQQQNIISVLKSDERKYRNLQDRIAIAETFSEKNNKYNQIITDITSLISTQVKINNLIFKKDQVVLDADIISVSVLADFVDALKNYRNIKSINIENIENKPSVGLSVNISAMLK